MDPVDTSFHCVPDNQALRKCPHMLALKLREPRHVQQCSTEDEQQQPKNVCQCFHRVRCCHKAEPNRLYISVGAYDSRFHDNSTVCNLTASPEDGNAATNRPFHSRVSFWSALSRCFRWLFLTVWEWAEN